MLRSALGFVWLMSWAAPLGAQPSEEAVRFQYAAPPECPDAAAFTARVRDRTPRGRVAEPGELARTFDVDVTADIGGFSGQIEFLDEGGAKVNRRLHGEQCDAVVSSLALITALALDATLRAAEPEAPPDEPQPSEKTPAPEKPPPPTVQLATKARPSAAPESKLLHARIGIYGGISKILSNPQGDLSSTRMALMGQLEWRSSSALRLSAHLDTLDEFTVDEGRRAELRIVGVETSFCPWVLRSREVGFYPCGVVDLGSLRAEGKLGDKLTTAGGKTILWASVGADARLLFDSSALPLWLELSGSAGFPLVAKYRFEFSNPTAQVFRVPRFTMVLGVAFGVRFW